jgi:hypothetical protein
MNSNRVADPMSGPSRWVNSRRTDRQDPRLRELDLKSLPFVFATGDGNSDDYACRSKLNLSLARFFGFWVKT